MAMAWEQQGQVWIGRMGRLRQLIALPAWARVILMIVALPGILAVALSVLAFLVSLLTLLVLTVPVYRLLSAMTLPARPQTDVEVETLFPRAGVKRVDATVRDATEADVKHIE